MTEKGWDNWNAEAKEKKLTSTLKETLDLFLKGKSIQQICTIRGFQLDTVERQIIELITKSFINADDVISNREEIEKIISKVSFGLSEIKKAYPTATWFEIKCTIAAINAKPKTK